MLADHFSLRIPKQVLWPATHRAYAPATARSVPQIPYAITFVGNISYPSYGLEIMLEAMGLVNDWQHTVLNLVCPERNLKDQPNILAPFRDRTWLRVHHLHGNALQPVYQTSCLGLVPAQRTAYNDLAMPVKLFEYLSYGLPVVVTDCTEMAQFVNGTGVGLVSQDNAESLASTICTILKDPAVYCSAADAVRKAVERDHRWVDRARQVAEALVPSTGPAQ
jgi:glycosyltransferase involved in cell wall biosynthesis